MKLGYIRVSKTDQNIARQVDALEAQCDEVLVEKLSAAARERPVMDQALRRLKPGDVFVILDLDRAFRSTVDAILTAERLKEDGIGFQIINAHIDTSSEFGEVIYGVMALLAQFERRQMVRRTREGLKAAKRRGQKLGRRRKLTADQINLARRLIESGEESCASMAKTFGVERTTVWRALRSKI